MLLILLLVLTGCNKKDDSGSGEVADTPKEVITAPEESVEKTDEEATDQQLADQGSTDQASNDKGSIDQEAVIEEKSEEKSDEDTGTTKKLVSVDLLDAEAMVDRLGKYLLRAEDLPHSYTIPEDGEQHTSTMRLIQEMGEIEAKTYVRDTGRIDGWWLRLKRTNKADFAPGSFESSIELFTSAAGAQTAMTPAYYLMYKDESREYSPVDGGCNLGDYCEFYYSEKKDPATELVTAQYNLAFSYRNAFAWVMARGLTIDMDPEYVIDAARAVLAKLEAAPTQ